MGFWNHIYEHFNPIAFEFFGLKIHWYGIMYVLALLSALFMAKWIVKKDSLLISVKDLDNYFIWVEIGVILGARLGYILFYDPHTTYYLSHPWQIFNPFIDGVFVGIRGMSYHGALIGFLVASFAFSKKHKISQWFLLDIVAISVPLGYVFGRFGNFLNQELVGRYTTVPWGIYVDGVLRHPSQLYEAFLEGVLIYIIIYLYRRHKRFEGELIALYGLLYSIARFIAEFFREPDFQMGFVYGGWMSMGQVLSVIMATLAVGLYLYLKSTSKKTLTTP